MRTPRPRFLLPALVLAGLTLPTFTPGPAHADVAPEGAERHQIYSPYELETIHEVLKDAKVTEDPSPEGKRIDRVEIVRLDVFEERDVIPKLLKLIHLGFLDFNVLHSRTKDSVVRSEVLLHPGDRYSQATVDDSIRNIRRIPGLPQLSVVIALAAHGSTEDSVVLYVVTKDVWSLRLNWGLVGTLNGIDQFVIQPSENNVAGTHQIATGTFIYEPSAYTAGLGYMIPRIAGSRIAIQAYANTMVNHQTGKLEGSYGDLVAGAPLFAGTTKWAWDANVYFQDVEVRRYENAALSDYVDPSTGQSIPFEYRARAYRAAYSLTRSWGWNINHDLTLSAVVNRSTSVLPLPSGSASAQTIADFATANVPVSDTQVGPSLQYHSYAMNYVRVVNFDTLSLQEDYRLGHDVIARVYPSFSALGASRSYVGTYAAAQYTWALRDGLARVSFQATTDFDANRIWDGVLQPTAHIVSPSIPGIGRFVLDGSAEWRYRNYLNIVDYLGGDDRLRGYPTNFFVGRNVLAYNLEWRTRPVDLFSLQVGAVAFFDIGTATNSKSLGNTYQSAGVGIRALFPWLDRTTFRADFGVPFERPIDPGTVQADASGHVIPGSGRAISPYAFVVSFGQAFGTPNVAPPPGTLASEQIPNPQGGTILGLPTGQAPDAP